METPQKPLMPFLEDLDRLLKQAFWDFKEENFPTEKQTCL